MNREDFLKFTKDIDQNNNSDNKEKIKSASKTIGSSGEDGINSIISNDKELTDKIKTTISLYPDIYQKAGIKGIIRYMAMNGQLDEVECEKNND